MSGDDVTKPESSNTQTTQDGTGTNVGKYARKKSGIKPIRPSGFSASSLNPTTPGKLSVYHPTTPGKLPQTPRMSYFRENELPRMNLHSEFATSKYFQTIIFFNSSLLYFYFKFYYEIGLHGLNQLLNCTESRKLISRVNQVAT